MRAVLCELWSMTTDWLSSDRNNSWKLEAMSQCGRANQARAVNNFPSRCSIAWRQTIDIWCSKQRATQNIRQCNNHNPDSTYQESCTDLFQLNTHISTIKILRSAASACSSCNVSVHSMTCTTIMTRCTPSQCHTPHQNTTCNKFYSRSREKKNAFRKCYIIVQSWFHQ